jgi:hypothetical protein
MKAPTGTWGVNDGSLAALVADFSASSNDER